MLRRTFPETRTRKLLQSLSDCPKRRDELLCRGRNFNRKTCLVIVLMLSWAAMAWAQGEAEDIQTILKDEILSPAVAEFQIRQYLINATAPLPKVPATPQEWTSAAARLRHHLLDNVVYHGWPKEWVESAPKFEEVGVIETGDGYRIHRFRYEIVPGFES